MVGIALELNNVEETNLVRVSHRCIAITFTLTFLLNGCTQTARQSASVTNVGCSVHRRIEVFKEELALATDQWLCIRGETIWIITILHIAF